jgi:putative membrane protein
MTSPALQTGLKLTAFAIGAGILAFLVHSVDFAAVVDGIVGVGWGIAGIVAYRFVNLHFDTLGWFRLIAASTNSGQGTIFLFRWIGESVNQLLPAAQVGGEVVRARLLARAGFPAVASAASVVVDFTMGLASQFVFTLIGAGLLIAYVGMNGQGELIGFTVVAMAAIVVAVYAVQRFGGFAGTARLLRSATLGRKLAGFADGMEVLDGDVRALYARRTDLLVCGSWRFASWMAHVVEVWLIFWFLDNQIGWGEALVLESLGAAVRSVAFAVPGAIGVQEGGLILIGLALGIGAEQTLAMALVKRAREILVAGPGLIAWWLAERRPVLSAGENPP